MVKATVPELPPLTPNLQTYLYPKTLHRGGETVSLEDENCPFNNLNFITLPIIIN